MTTLGQIQALGAPRAELSQFGAGFNFRHSCESARLVALRLTPLFPKLRDGVRVTGQK